MNRGDQIHDVGATLFVEAGAGTGKTTALVNRVVALVKSGIAIDRIAAITFTERAAAELKDRVRQGLAEAQTCPDGTGEVEAALKSLDLAQMSTIHAFCRGLILRFAAEAAVDPDFTVLDEVSASRRQEETWRVFLEQLHLQATDQEAVDRILRLGLSTMHLALLARELSEAESLAALIAANPPVRSTEVWPDLDEVRLRLEQTGFRQVPEEDRLRTLIAALHSWTERMRVSNPREREVLLATTTVKAINAKQGNKDNWGSSEAKNFAIDTGQDVQKKLAETLATLRTNALAAVLPIIVRYVIADQQARGREGKLTFDDMILRVRDLLAASPPAREAFRQQFDQLLIDEFQDTDPLQSEIARSFAEDPATGQIQPGRLFLVGDPKQSIYRFRGADMSAFARVRESMKESGAGVEELDVNHRSRPVILDWVNSVFARMIGDGANPMVQPAYKPIQPRRDDQLAGPGVAIVGGAIEALASVIREMESSSVAALCKQVVEIDGWQVSDHGEPRPARYRDIAILIPVRTGLDSLETSLADAQIPYRVEGGSLVLRTQEVRDLMNCLSAIDNPADEVAIVAALRSPAFACSDRDLAEFKIRQRGDFNYISSRSSALTGPVAEGLAVLRQFHDLRHDQSLAVLIERFIGARGLVETGTLFFGNRNPFRRARYLVDSARDFEAAGPQSLRAFISWLERQTVVKTFAREGADLDDDEDAIRIMTVHAAKGLEFPIVIMAGLSSQSSKQGEMLKREYATHRYSVTVGPDARQFQVGDSVYLGALSDEHAKAERARLLYVAATRARDHLVVSLFRKVNTDCAAQVLTEAGAEEGAERFSILPQTAHPRAPFAGLNVEDDPALEEGDITSMRIELADRATTRKYTSATALKVALGGSGGADRLVFRDDEGEPWARGRARTRLGRAVHATIQSLPMDATADVIRATSHAQAVAEAVPHMSQEIEQLVTWIVTTSQAWKRARESGRALREVPFALETSGHILEGFIDMVIEEPDGMEIVDWKTDRITAGEVPGRLEEYKLQAGLYVHGLQAATNLPVARVTYVFAGAQAEESPGVPDDLEAEALAALTSKAP
jgi:ATP-dependent helicase/nuclease subunit A